MSTTRYKNEGLIVKPKQEEDGALVFPLVEIVDLGTMGVSAETVPNKKKQEEAVRRIE